MTATVDHASIRLGDWTDGERRLLLTSCTECGNRWYLPRQRCPECGNVDMSFAEVSGHGLCVALTRLYATAEEEPEPIGLVLVELDEGPVVMGRTSFRDDVAAIEPGDLAQLDFLILGDEQRLVPHFSRRT